MIMESGHLAMSDEHVIGMQSVSCKLQCNSEIGQMLFEVSIVAKHCQYVLHSIPMHFLQYYYRHKTLLYNVTSM